MRLGRSYTRPIMAHVKTGAMALLALVFGITAASMTATSQNKTSSPKTTYTSSHGDFQFQYPSYLIDCKAQRDNESCSAYMPDCSGTSEDSVACIAYPKTRISASERKTFDGAAFVVAVVKDAHDAKACRETMDRPPPDWKHPRTTTIHAVEFWATENSSAAMSHHPSFRTFSCIIILI